MLQTPVLLIIFNRPGQASLVMEEIRKQSPAYLFIAGDGPRQNHPRDQELCKETRDRVLAFIDWPCEVHTLFQPVNQGCGRAVSMALNWFFAHVEEGIILEDDCLPDPSFFPFCTQLLKKYKDHPSIMHISGDNFQFGKVRGNASYYFTRIAHVWGWATWKRAWRQYDFSLDSYRNLPLKKYFPPGLYDMVDSIYREEVDTWDIQWMATVWLKGGMAIAPNTSLVFNIGYDEKATHTRRTPSWFNQIRYGSIQEISHPSREKINEHADKFEIGILFKRNRLKTWLKRLAHI